jgi:hypothetical protein
MVQEVVRFDEKTGIFSENGVFLVVGYTMSREFKSFKNAEKWAKKIGLGD